LRGWNFFSVVAAPWWREGDSDGRTRYIEKKGIEVGLLTATAAGREFLAA
jgi:hypothetical protein